MYRAGPGLALASALLVAGCASSDVMVFGTQTTVGANLSAAPAQGGAPRLVIGYDRYEAVWLPLRPAAQPAIESTGPDQTNTVYGAPPSDFYQSQILVNGQVVRKDSYSVFASLGARFNGTGKASEVSAGAGLAQFFATGAAAVSLVENKALVTVLKMDSAEGAEAQAGAVAAASGATGPAAFDALVATLPAAQRASIVSAAQAAHGQRALAVSQLGVCARDAQGAWRWDQIVDAMQMNGAAIPPDFKTYLKTAKDQDGIQRLIGDDTDSLASAKAAAVQLNFCT